MKKVIGWIILTPILSFLGYSVCYLLMNDTNPTYVDCGVVKSKSSSEVSIKHGSETELYLNIDFDKSGFISKKTAPTTYFSNSVGDRVCFDIKETTTFNHRLLSTIGFIMCGLLFLLSVVLFLMLIFWLFDY
jgi:hypothetical protein